MSCLITRMLCFVAATTASLPTASQCLQADENPSNGPISIVVSPTASAAEALAAGDLARYLGKLYSHQSFVVRTRRPASGACILLGTPKSNPELERYIPANWIAKPESFCVSVKHDQAGDTAVIAGADPLGCVYGVYAVLERLGCGFYLSYDALPEPKTSSFSFEGWELADQPLAADRIVFDWHNFLSGCSGWNDADWKEWIEQSQKMRFNTVMVHAYGNNPMFTFQFGGQEKPVGYLSSTIRGRDWSNEHVNDVRRLVGGSVFGEPVFGAEAALLTENRYVAAVQDMMRRVFAEAAGRGMHVCFALDVDTDSSNPQELIMSLPEAARFKKGNLWFANPDTPEGYAYYRAQVESLLKLYPQIDRLAIWARVEETTWITLAPADLPASWHSEFQALAADDPTSIKPSAETAEMRAAAPWFALNKVVAAFKRALGELHRNDVRLMVGSWQFQWMPTADHCFPQDIPFVMLDYDVLDGNSVLDASERREAMRHLAAHRSIIPIVWAHHDDGAYRGRSYTPFDGFQAKLADSGTNSFGIIHWTTRPLDLYFKNLSKQVWSETTNQSLPTTCEEMAERSFGPTARKAGAEYLSAWITEAPQFSRETTDCYMDRPVAPDAAQQVATGCRRRLAILDRIDATGLDEAAKQRVAYYRDLEEFTAAFFQAECLYQQGCDTVAKGDFDSLRQAVAECRPETVVELYASVCRHGGGNRGELAELVSINLRWLPYYIGLRQSLALEPVRLKFAPTSHEPLAQGKGLLTFFADSERHLWRVYGGLELRAEPFTWPEDAEPKGSAEPVELCRSGIESDRPLTLKLLPFLRDMGFKSARALRPGQYRVRLLAADPISTAPGQRVFSAKLTMTDASDQKTSVVDEKTVDLFEQTGEKGRVTEVVMQFEQSPDRQAKLTLTPVNGKALICAVIVEPK